MRYWTILIFLFVSAQEANASITIGEFLQQAHEDAAELWVSGDDAQRHRGNWWVESAEIRYSDDDDPNDKRSLALRLEPKGFGQKSAEDEILRLRQKQRRLMFESALNEALRQRYGQLLELWAEQLSVHKIEQQIALSMDERKLQHDLSVTNDFRPENLLQSELRADQLRNNRQSHLKRLLDMRTHLHINQLPDNMVTIDEMVNIITTMPRSPDGSDVQAARLKVEMARQQRKLESAKQGVALSFLELKHERDVQKDDVLGMTVGIRIPFGASYAGSQRADDVADAMYDLQLQQRAHQRNIMSESDILHWHKMQADAIGKTLGDIQQRILPAMRSGNTELLLTLKRQQLEEKGKLADIRLDAVRHYLNYLSITGRLTKAPLRNWLLSGQPVLGPGNLRRNYVSAQ